MTMQGRTQFVDGTVVIFNGENSGRIGYRMAAQQTGIITVERIVSQSLFLKRLHNAVTETRIVVITHLAQHDKIRLQTGYLPNNGFISLRHHGALLPDIELQHADIF